MAEERRLVTVLFADVAGSTELGETLDPEDTRALLSRFYAIAKEVVAGHGGTVEKFIGDAVMAVFGLPVAHGDDAERAISAALEISDRVRSDPKLGDRIPVRLGVNTGEVVAARDSSAGDFLVTGDAVNLAARLQQAADSWSVLCGERSVHAAAHAFAFSPLASITVKGKRAGVRAARAIGRAAVRRARIPIVGRDADLAQLDLLARRAFAERRPQLVSIIAPAGTGKTRLLEEFLEDLPRLAPDATVAIAQCLPYGQRLTYWPLRAVLFRLAAIPEDAQPAAIREGIRRWLAASELENREPVADLLAATVGAGETEVSDRAALFAAWRSAIEFASSRSALVVAFEDLHWSSESLLDLVEFVMQPRGELPVLMVALTRPELLDRRPSWGGGKRNYVALSLEPLPDDAVGELVRHLLEASSPEIVSRVVARAEGNPFYAGELVRALLDRVSSPADAASVERALATLPDTVQATVLARLDLLRPEERRILQLGAVLGRSFRTRGIRALAPELDDVETAVDALVEKDLVRATSADAFTFRHILIREVAYQTLPRAERARLHAAAARWLEEFAAGREDAFAELIAYHYREAATLSPVDERDAAIRRGAVTWLGRAAEVALTGAANVEAVRHLRAAVDLADAEELPELHERIGDAHTSGEAADAYGVALRLGRELGRPVDQQLRCLAGMLTVYMRQQGSIATRPSDEALNALRGEARALLPRATEARAIARFHIADSFYPFWNVGAAISPTETELDIAEESARTGLALAERLGDRRLESAALDGVGSVLSLRGNFAASRELARRRTTMDGLDLVERLDAFSVATWMSVFLGELDEAIRVSADGLAHVQPGQGPAWALHLVAWRTLALALRGQWDEAIAQGHRARLLWIEADRLSAGYAQRGFLAVFGIAKARRNAPLADLFGEVIEEIAQSFGPSVFAGRGRLAVVRGDLDDLERSLRDLDSPGPDNLEQAFALLSDAGRPPSPKILELAGEGPRDPRAILLRGQVHRAAGLARRNEHELGLALEIFERCAAIPSVARVRCEHGLIAADSAELEAGLRMLDELGDVEQMERYERWAKRV